MLPAVLCGMEKMQEQILQSGMSSAIFFTIHLISNQVNSLVPKPHMVTLTFEPTNEGGNSFSVIHNVNEELHSFW